MRGVLIGADLMYREDGKIVPIEINTNVGWDVSNRKETEQEALDPTDLIEYAKTQGVTDIYLEGKVLKLRQVWPKDAGIAVHALATEDLRTFEDKETDLVLRTSYDDEAYVDNFCRDKINFLNSIKDESFGAEYILKSEGELIGEITKLYDNGVYPNIIVKYRYPVYDRNVYPLCLNFKSLEDLRTWAENNLEEDHFMMPFYYNAEHGIYTEEEAGHEDHKRILFFRNWSAFIVNDEGRLDSVELGKYTKATGLIDESKLVWNEDGTAVDPGAIRYMLFQDKWANPVVLDTLLDEDDVVLMEDHTWKKAQDLQIGDRVQSLTIPVSGNVDIRSHTADYNVSLEEWEEYSQWDINEITFVSQVEAWLDKAFLTFTDGTDWNDTLQSSYPVLDPEDDSVRFVNLKDLKVGDRIILMPFEENILSSNPAFVVREVESIEVRRELQYGYAISLDGNHLFLSRTSEDTLAYIAIEHNVQAMVLYFYTNNDCSGNNPDAAGYVIVHSPTSLLDCLYYANNCTARSVAGTCRQTTYTDLPESCRALLPPTIKSWVSGYCNK